ncbi:MAG: calcium/sodium antiporter [bacterium]|nr:calcium/sodium antiporter [bacterium]
MAVVLVSILAVGFGASSMVEAAGRIAKRLGVSELIIGLTVVAFGTSAPEFAVTLYSAFQGHGDISVGNIVGSNIFNLGFILGGCALVSAIPTSRQLLQRDGLVLGASTVLILLLVGIDLKLTRGDGLLLFTLLIIYLVYLFKNRHDEEANSDENDEEIAKTMVHDVIFLILGLLGIVVGAFVMVESATALARSMGVSDWVIAVTIVAAGTSAPEFATSLAGVLKGRFEISAGNLIGSDIFNLLGVLGAAGIMQEMAINEAARISLFALCGMVFLVLYFMKTGWKISRLEGGILVLIALLRWVFDFIQQTPSQ